MKVTKMFILTVLLPYMSAGGKIEWGNPRQVVVTTDDAEKGISKAKKAIIDALPKEDPNLAYSIRNLGGHSYYKFETQELIHRLRGDYHGSCGIYVVGEGENHLNPEHF